MKNEALRLLGLDNQRRVGGLIGRGMMGTPSQRKAALYFAATGPEKLFRKAGRVFPLDGPERQALAESGGKGKYRNSPEAVADKCGLEGCFPGRCGRRYRRRLTSNPGAGRSGGSRLEGPEMGGRDDYSGLWHLASAEGTHKRDHEQECD